MNYTDVLQFWFEALDEKDQFSGGERVDQLIKDRFSAWHAAVVANECASWRETAEGSLAEIIVLDQFSRNLYRGTKAAFAADGQAVALAQVAIARGFDQELTPDKRLFLYLPFMHSESRVVHETALQLFTDLGIESTLQYEVIHKEIIDRFGRYPHRNQQLGRESTAAEITYLESESQSFFAS